MTDEEKIRKYFGIHKDVFKLAGIERNAGTPYKTISRAKYRRYISAEHIPAIKKYMVEVLMIDFDKI